MNLVCSATANNKIHSSRTVSGADHTDAWNNAMKWLSETYKTARLEYGELTDFTISIRGRDQKQLAKSLKMPDFD